MAMKFFLMYIGVFFAGSAALLAIVKTLVLNFTIKKVWVYGLLFSVLTAAVAFGMLYLSDNPSVVYWLLAIVFFVAGCVHYGFTHKKYFQPKKFSSKANAGEFLFSVAVAFFILVLFSVCVYFIYQSPFMFYPVLMSLLLFFLPYLYQNMFRTLVNIPTARFATWEYPEKIIDLPDEVSDERLLVIGFEIAKKPTDPKTYFRAKAPEKMLLGELYYHFINDYNDVQSETPIQYQDEDRQMTEWWFRVKPKWYQFTRILDPYKTISDNSIKENTVIICERVD